MKNAFQADPFIGEWVYQSFPIPPLTRQYRCERPGPGLFLVRRAPQQPAALTGVYPLRAVRNETDE